VPCRVVQAVELKLKQRLSLGQQETLRTMREEVRCARPLILPSAHTPPAKNGWGAARAGGATAGHRRLAHAHPSPAAPQRRAWAAHQPIWWVPCDCAQVAAESGRCAEARAKMSLTLQAASVEAAARGRAAVEEEGRSRDVALQQVREGGSGGGTREIREYYGSRSHLLFETHVYNLTPASSPLISLHIGHASASSFKASGLPCTNASLSVVGEQLASACASKAGGVRLRT
jgi:hypothetical protein